ncbi:glutamate receptor ionotropic, kainate 3-like [Octopus vulgaris]|nr:glutamate receptor ionotropic, kainate 3-like [Octopus vulgaris]
MRLVHLLRSLGLLVLSSVLTYGLHSPKKVHTIGILVEKTLSWMVMSSHKILNTSTCDADTWQLGAVKVVHDVFQSNDLPSMQNCIAKMQAEGVAGIVVLAMCDNQLLLHQLLRQKNIPHVPVPSTYCYRDHFEEGRSPWRLRQRASTLSLVIKDTIKALNFLAIKEIIIFTDGTYNINQASVILQSLSEENIRFMAYQVNYTNASYKSVLEWTKKSIKRTYFLLLTYGHGSMEILNCARDLELIRYNTFWIIANLDMNIEELKTLDLQNVRANILYIKKPCISSSVGISGEQNGFNISITDNYLLQTVSRYFTYCLNMSETTPQPSEIWQAELFFPIAEMEFDETNDNMFMVDPEEVVDRKYDIFRVDGYEEEPTYKRIGEWCSEVGLVFMVTPIDARDVFPNALPGLGNATLKVGTVVLAPYITRVNGTGWEGFCIDILNEMSSTMNFNYILQEPEDKMFGVYDNATHNWTGVIGMAYNNEVDLGIGPITLTAHRFEYIDFTHPFSEDGIGIAYRLEDDRVSMDMIFRPFQLWVWILTPGAIFFVGIFLTVINKISAIFRSTKACEELNCSYYENCWYTLGTALMQGQNNEPKNVSGRIVIIFWWLFVILLTTYYTAFLAAILTVKVSKLSITSLEDLAHHPSIKPITLSGSTWWSYFLKSRNPSYRTIGREIRRSPNVTDTARIMEMVLTENFAYVMDSSVVRYFAAKDKKAYAFVEEKGYRQSLGFITPKHSAIREMLSFNIIKFQELGLIEKWRRQWCNCTKQLLLRKSVETKALALEDLGGAFTVAGGTALASILLAFMEKVISKYRKSKVLETPIEERNEQKDLEQSSIRLKLFRRR